MTIRVPANFAGGSFTINATIVDNALTEAKEDEETKKPPEGGSP